MFLAGKSFREELLFKLVVKHEQELPTGQELKGIPGRGDSLSKGVESAVLCGPQ